MGFPITRLRRLRANEALRRMVRETSLSVDDLVFPFFVIHGRGIKEEIPSMPGNYRWSVDRLEEVVEAVVSARVPAVLLFGIPPHKDEMGSGAYDEEGIIQQAVRRIKELAPQLIVITDVCLCEYTSHGHCGVVRDGVLLNDPTLELLQRTALSQVRAGADMVAPSDMMDGRVKAIREALDAEGYSHIPIMAYSAKFASAFYGPFREAADSAPKFGDRRSYQMDPANVREALREIALDVEEGADVVMVKPALAYLDVIRAAREATMLPLAAYWVSGEYAMLKAAAAQGWLDERRATLEVLTAIRRAGADIIITYAASDAARWLGEEEV